MESELPRFTANNAKQQRYSVSADPALLQLNVIFEFLTSSYWARGIDFKTVEMSVKHSLCVGAYDSCQSQVGFARAITDYSTFAYLADVFVLPAHQGNGLGTRIVNTLLEDHRLTGLRRWVLATRDAHALYERFGFAPLSTPGIFMEINQPKVYMDAKPSPKPATQTT